MVKVAVVYVCPVVGYGLHHYELACQFVASWMQFPAGHNCDLFVVSNGGEPDSRTKALFALIDARFIIHDDSGYDVGAYQCAASQIKCDLMVFLGGSTYIRGENWLARAVAAFVKYGPGLYGAMGHSGGGNIHPHIRTTGFWMPPQLFNQYPIRVVSPSQRYPFEHGPGCLTSWVQSRGFKAWVVTWNSEHDSGWNLIPGGYHSGNQEGLILGDRLSAPPFHPVP